MSQGFWAPLEKFRDPEFYENFDMAVKAYIQVDMTNYIVQNMSAFIKEKYELQELESFCNRWSLSSLIIEEYHLHFIASRLDTLTTLYKLEKEVWSHFTFQRHLWVIDKLSKHYRTSMEKLILRHSNTKTDNKIPQMFSRCAKFNQLISKVKNQRHKTDSAPSNETKTKSKTYQRFKSILSRLSILS